MLPIHAECKNLRTASQQCSRGGYYERGRRTAAGRVVDRGQLLKVARYFSPSPDRQQVPEGDSSEKIVAHYDQLNRLNETVEFL